MDTPFAYESLLIFPQPELQENIVQILKSDTPKKLHNPHYNMLAYPYSDRYQNSNQWAFAIIASALANRKDLDRYERTQAWMQFEGFRGSTLDIPAVTRLGARLFRANVAFDDQPMGRRIAGKIETTTVESIVSFLDQKHLILEKKQLNYP